jgi:Delta6-protoilludene synthase
LFFSFWKRTVECSSSSSAQRFIRDFDEYTDAVRQEAVEREAGFHRNLQDYYALRRRTVGARPAFNLFLLPEDIPDEVLESPLIGKLAIDAIDMILLANVSHSLSTVLFLSLIILLWTHRTYIRTIRNKLQAMMLTISSL